MKLNHLLLLIGLTVAHFSNGSVEIDNLTNEQHELSDDQRNKENMQMVVYSEDVSMTDEQKKPFEDYVNTLLPNDRIYKVAMYSGKRITFLHCNNLREFMGNSHVLSLFKTASLEKRVNNRAYAPWKGSVLKFFLDIYTTVFNSGEKKLFEMYTKTQHENDYGNIEYSKYLESSIHIILSGCWSDRINEAMKTDLEEEALLHSGIFITFDNTNPNFFAETNQWAGNIIYIIKGEIFVLTQHVSEGEFRTGKDQVQRLNDLSKILDVVTKKEDESILKSFAKKTNSINDQEINDNTNKKNYFSRNFWPIMLFYLVSQYGYIHFTGGLTDFAARNLGDRCPEFIKQYHEQNLVNENSTDQKPVQE